MKFWKEEIIQINWHIHHLFLPIPSKIVNPYKYFLASGGELNFVNIGFAEYLKTKYVSGNLLSLPVFVTVYTMWHNVETWCGHNGIIKHSRELS